MLGGRYELLRPVADPGRSSATGSRWYAVDHLLGIRVRVTELAIDTLDHRTTDRLRDQVRTAATFAHPNAVGVFDLVVDAGRAYLVEEHAHGQALADRLARGSLGRPAADRIVREIGAALVAARSRAVVLGDINVNTVLITPTGVARLDGFASALLPATPTDDVAALGDLAAALGVSRVVAAAGFPQSPITAGWLATASKASSAGPDPARAEPRRGRANTRHRWRGLAASVTAMLAVAALVVVLARQPSRSPAGLRLPVTSAAPASRIPLAPTGGGCTSLVGSIIWTWRAASNGPPVVSYEVDEDASGIRFPIKEPHWRSFHADADVHMVAVFAVGKDGSQSQRPLEISCRAGSIERYGYIADPSGDATASVGGTADMTALNWTWGSLGLQLLVTFAARTDIRQVAVVFYFDTDRNPATGYPGIGCRHTDASMVGVERVFVANDVSVAGGTLGADCRLQPVPTAASVVADHAIEVTIPRSEFAGQVGEVGVKVGAAIVTGWKDPLAVPVQDELSDSGQPPVKVYCQP
jgi:hypothetical protein